MKGAPCRGGKRLKTQERAWEKEGGMEDRDREGDRERERGRDIEREKLRVSARDSGRLPLPLSESLIRLFCLCICRDGGKRET